MHVSIPYFSGIPEDVCTNVWSFNFVSPSPSGADWNALRTALNTFYASAYASTAGSLSMANYALPANTRWKGYDLSDPEPRAPVYDVTFAIAPITLVSSVLPPETAVCCSFQGALISGAPQARRRGRIFLGCIGTAWATSTTSSFPDLNLAKRTGLAAAMGALLTATAAADWTWCVWSRTNGVMVPVTNGWVDNAPDTQRRRGNAPSLRTTWP